MLITVNPQVINAGEIDSIISKICDLCLRNNKHELLFYEALLALTNIAAVNLDFAQKY